MKRRIFPCLLVTMGLSTGETMRIENRDGRVIDITVIGTQNEAVRVRKGDGKEFEIPFASLTEESVKRIKQSMVAAPVGDSLPKIKVQTEAIAPAEATSLTNLYPLLDDWRSETLYKPEADKTLKLRADCDAILDSLAKMHADLSVKDRCERLLAIACSRLQGGSVTTRLGAASCLTQIQGPEATACLFQGLDSNLPEAVEMECQRGLGERCTGKVLDQLLEMFISADSKTRSRGGFALTYITTKAQLAELKERAKAVVTTEEALDRLNAVFALTRNLKD